MVSDLLLWWCRWWECGGGSGFGFDGRMVFGLIGFDT